ncbi:PACE efflux transporter [Shewanella insulae]|uniref:PACE efflux transporter n=1 Tax=Shewanella insulae TaxID=2681496 RepID=UPI001EFDFA5E|nr:PACE efflux transporter [Shewanella insulae]MCG9739976.1 PACE efflux transporter [Shewanella insulae]
MQYKTRFDRIRYLVGFELGAMALAVPLGAWLTSFDSRALLALAIGMSLIAAAWNYGYNLLFDKAMLYFKSTMAKSATDRVWHSLLFELGLLIISVPIMATYLSISYWEAFWLDIGFVIFYLIFNYCYTYLYDKLFYSPRG